jgi:low affinity Fe/Cu permease
LVWIAADPVAGVSGGWWFLASLMTAASAVSISFIQNRRARPSKQAQRKHIRSAADEAVREYRELYVDELRAEVKRLQARVTASEDRAELYRKRLDDYIRDHRGD